MATSRYSPAVSARGGNKAPGTAGASPPWMGGESPAAPGWVTESQLCDKHLFPCGNSLARWWLNGTSLVLNQPAHSWCCGDACCRWSSRGHNVRFSQHPTCPKLWAKPWDGEWSRAQLWSQGASRSLGGQEQVMPCCPGWRCAATCVWSCVEWLEWQRGSDPVWKGKQDFLEEVIMGWVMKDDKGGN